MAKLTTSDPLEQIIEASLQKAGIQYHTETAKENEHNLDFYLPELDIYIEIKSGHTPRISGQMARHPNVIAVQGVKSTKFLASLIETAKP